MVVEVDVVVVVEVVVVGAPEVVFGWAAGTVPGGAVARVVGASVVTASAPGRNSYPVLWEENCCCETCDKWLQTCRCR